MADFLNSIVEAHGGLERWWGVRSVDIDFNFSGAVLELKGRPGHLRLSVSIDLQARRSVFQRLGPDPDQRWIFTSDRVWIERRDGSSVEERPHPRAAFAGHALDTRWDDLHLTYFIGYAIWNYLSVPFLLLEPGFEVREGGEHQEDGETWRVLDVTFPDGVPAHTKEQRFYFGPDLLLRRLDYAPDVMGGGSAAAHYCYEYRPGGRHHDPPPSPGRHPRRERGQGRQSDGLPAGLCERELARLTSDGRLA